MRKLAAITIGCCAVLLPGLALAQYNASAGRSVPRASRLEAVKDSRGRTTYRRVEHQVQSDRFGNAAGTQYDLAVDGAFKGKTVAVLHLYTGEGFDFHLPKAALAQKGFAVYRWINQPPAPAELRRALRKACQLWVISGQTRLLTDAHIKVIREFFDSGRGVYIWGDNEPYYADANAVASALLDVTMKGNLPGDKTVRIQRGAGAHRRGVLPNHLLTTGLEYVYEGITIATLEKNRTLTPLIYGSAGNLVAGFYDKGGKRAILDGGFTRLYHQWNTAGTGRYVKNAAAWLVNHERFGNKVASATAAQ